MKRHTRSDECETEEKPGAEERNNIESQVSNKERRWSQLFAVIPSYLLSFCYGTNSAFVALLTPQLREDCSEFHITYDQESWIVSLDNLFTPVICVISAPLQHLIGPRSSLQVACIPYILAWAITILAADFKLLYLARLFVGISHALFSTSVYNIEVLSSRMRGPLDIMGASFRSLGSVTIFVLGIYFRWNFIAKLALGVPLLALIFSMFVPESPTYLMYSKQEDRARHSMNRLYGTNFDTDRKMTQIRDNIASITNGGGKKGDYLTKINKHPELYKPFLIVALLSLVQMFSGASAIRGYVIKIFDKVFDEAMPSSNSTVEILVNGTVMPCVKYNSVSNLAYISGIIIGVFRFLSTMSLARLLVKYKRRTMYLISMILSCFGLLLFALFFWLVDMTGKEIYSWLSLVATCFIVFAVQLGVQTLPFLYSGELFPSDIRALCKSLSRCFTTILLMLILKVFPEMVYQLSLSLTFLVFSFIIAIFFPIMYYILPETKGLDLETIQQNFMKRRRSSTETTDSGIDIEAEVMSDHQEHSFEDSPDDVVEYDITVDSVRKQERNLEESTDDVIEDDINGDSVRNQELGTKDTEESYNNVTGIKVDSESNREISNTDTDDRESSNISIDENNEDNDNHSTRDCSNSSPRKTEKIMGEIRISKN